MSFGSIAQRYRTTLGCAAALLFLFVCQPTPLLLSVGSVLVLLGLLVRIWAAGHLEKARRLTTSGPYGHTRNPLYFGSFLILAGFVIAGGNWIAGGGILLFFPIIYVPTMRREEQELRNGFKSEFDRYASAVPLFIPRWTAFAGSEGVFLLRRAIANREYNAWIGSGVGILLLLLKLQFPVS